MCCSIRNSQLERFVGEDLEAVSAAHSTYLRSKAKCDVARTAFLSLPKWVDAGEREERKEELEDAKHTVDAARSRCDCHRMQCIERDLRAQCSVGVQG